MHHNKQIKIIEALLEEVQNTKDEMNHILNKLDKDQFSYNEKDKLQSKADQGCDLFVLIEKIIAL